MKRFFLLLAVLTPTCLAATPGWLTSYDQALAFSAKTGRPILVNFTGSDWCGWCIKMKSETLSKPDFIKFASTNLILVELDFPNKIPQSPALKSANEKVKQTLKVNGFPTFVLVDSKGQEAGRQVGYLKGGVPAFTEQLTEWIATAKPKAK
ncbi:MAG: hypothetical protein RIS76_4114 [Verrucomicrobiota bacterium]|jgi:protein disulfide-isomerase